MIANEEHDAVEKLHNQISQNTRRNSTKKVRKCTFLQRDSFRRSQSVNGGLVPEVSDRRKCCAVMEIERLEMNKYEEDGGLRIFIVGAD